ncbi:hypothetical protein [uncultured Roseobacter sp.]|uniref:hypothetical protein n=1 Tax=uncultured Roseobacter sp. TaxID=114847 RepID=UPI0026292DD0|nr:hypothetical protein [uncultured Roseobacter sp.]
MSDLSFLITNGFFVALEAAGRLGPRAASRMKLRIFGLNRYLRGVEHSWRNPDHLRWSHVDQARHTRAGYPPAEFGAFLAELEKHLLFQSVDRLKDADPEGYFALFQARRFDLACVVLYTEVPDRRMAFVSVGTPAEGARKLAGLRQAGAARMLIAQVRALPKPAASRPPHP